MRHHITPHENIAPICTVTDIHKLSNNLAGQKDIDAIIQARIDTYPTLEEVIAEEYKNPDSKQGYNRWALIFQIAHTVVQLRKKLGLTQAQLAQLAGTTQPVIARLEGCNSSRMPSLDLLQKIAAAVNLELKISFEQVK